MENEIRDYTYSETYTQIDGFMEHDDGTLEAVDFYGED